LDSRTPPPFYSQPTVVNGRLFFGSGNGTVYSLDAKTGCLYWTFKSPSQGAHRRYYRRHRQEPTRGFFLAMGKPPCMQ